MKVLVTGKNSYVGNSFIEWMKECECSSKIDTISLRNTEWREQSFSKYDVVLHVAGIAHVDAKTDMKELYYKVNKDLTIEVAQKARQDGVKQFIFLSSIIVYGKESYEETNGMISQNTIPLPDNFYGNSKLEAERGILPLQTDSFDVVILRPPMIYGKNSKGNYPKLAKIAQILPIFPDFINKRSMLHIDNLCEFIKLMIQNKEKGIFFPQNMNYTNTSEMVNLIAKAHGKNIIMTKIFNLGIKISRKKINTINKIFGDLFYEKTMSIYKDTYHVRDLKESIISTETESE